MKNNVIYGTSIEYNYEILLKNILKHGQTRNVRKFKTKELSPFIFHTDKPLRNIITNPIRKINRAFSIIEFLWIMSGRNDVEMLEIYNSNISSFSDNNIIYGGAYGPKIQQQIKYIISCFKKDLFTRQAVLTIWDRNPSASKDIPCTIMMHFLCNSDKKLDMIVYMRSNDAWLGFPYDIYNFTMIQNYVAYLLKLKIGNYTHMVGSEHLYDNHFKKAELASEHTVLYKDIVQTDVIVSDSLKDVLDIEQLLRMRYLSNKLTKTCYKNILISDLKEPWKDMLLTLCMFLLKKQNKRN